MTLGSDDNSILSGVPKVVTGKQALLEEPVARTRY